MTESKVKIERVSFTALQSDLELIAQIKKRCLKLGIETNNQDFYPSRH